MVVDVSTPAAPVNMVRWWAVVMVWACVGVRSSWAACTVAEFPCRNKQCISLDRYCDGHHDCDDNSDEPSGCTPCNRTYYGRMGSTYTLQVPRPLEGTLPHFCQLTFIASGDLYGDLVQLGIEKFSLGRFKSHIDNGCPDGYMQIEELSRPLNAGFWCGTSWGHNVYYSETTAITLMLRVFNISQTSQEMTIPGNFQPQDTIMLRLSYRFLRKERAVLRYGEPYSPSYRGEDLPNSFCDKYFENCDKKNCKIQSPNFPGMYPRNLTCYYHIRQTRVPDGKVALVSVYQRNPHLIYIKDRNAPHLSRERRLEVGTSCHVIYDYLEAFDGNTTRSPVLAKLCKGGAPLSSLTASGPDLLLLFHASPYDFPFQDSPRRRTFGFELDVSVEFVDRESTAYVRKGSECEYEVSSQGQRSGYIQASAHSLLPNTTCSWRLLAGNTEIVWLYFLHYRHVAHPEMPKPAKCPNTLSIYNGDVALSDDTNSSSMLLGRFCKPDKLPRVCSEVHAPGPYSAPCSPLESYVSILPAMTLMLRYAAGTTPSHVEFLARYEFVDTRQWGDPTPDGGPCDRTFSVRPDRLFASPRDVFMFGRGGGKRLRCIYTFQVASYQRVSLRILRSKMGSECSTVYRNSSRRHECSHAGESGHPAIKIAEEPWLNVPVERACLCNVSHGRPFNLVSYTNRIQITFSVPYMSPTNDYNDYYFEGEYSVLEAPLEVTEGCNDTTRRLGGRYGNFTVGAGRGDLCASLPRLITATDASFLFMRVRGFTATEDNCEVASRINVYAAGGATPIASICPERRDVYTDIFSSGWEDYEFHFQYDEDLFSYQNTTSLSTTSMATYVEEYDQTEPKPPPESRDLFVEYIGNYSGRFMVTWIGIWRPLKMPSLMPKGIDPCPHRCPDISACLPEELWCDGIPHCPSGSDEGAAACGLLATLPWVYLIAAGVLLLSLVSLFIAVVIHRRQTQTQKVVVAAATAAVNNGTGMKSNTQDLLIPPENDSW